MHLPNSMFDKVFLFFLFFKKQVLEQLSEGCDL